MKMEENYSQIDFLERDSTPCKQTWIPYESTMSTSIKKSKTNGPIMNTSPRLNPSTLIKYKHLSFLIFDAPSENNLDIYIKDLEQNNVKHTVRACEPTYDKAIMASHGITVHDLAFPDGDAPPDSIINTWLRLVKDVLGQDMKIEAKTTIGVHCVAGLGR